MLTRFPTPDPFEWADYHGIDVLYVDLGRRFGEWCPADHTIRLHRDLTVIQQVSTCWHECAHYALSHDWGATPAQEAAANSWAAERLITLEQYAAMEQIYGRNPAAIADELGLMVWVVRTFRRDLEARRWREYFSGEDLIA